MSNTSKQNYQKLNWISKAIIFSRTALRRKLWIVSFNERQYIYNSLFLIKKTTMNCFQANKPVVIVIKPYLQQLN